MDQAQTNRVTMYKTVAAYLDSQNAVWNGMAPFVVAVHDFKNKLAAIDDAAQQQEAPSGASDSKAGARDALEDVLFLTSEALGVLAHASNDHDLRALTDVHASLLDKIPADELINRATLILARANARKTELATMQITQANLDELAQALQDFSAVKEQPRQATVDRMTKTESLAQLIRDAGGALRNQIDRLVNLFRRSNPEFVSGYRGARVVVDRAATHSTKPVASPPPPANP
jgi:hypothetical protein